MKTKRTGPGLRTTSPQQRCRTSYRLRPEICALIEAIAEAKEGLTRTQVVENAVELYARQVLGRRAADLVAVRRRSR